MRFVDEYRDPDAARACARAIARTVSRPWTLMEICGGQTHAIVRFGIDELLPPHLELVHGPGCPVCVTPPGFIDKAVEIALAPGVILASFGDMLRVPGSSTSLSSAKAKGADVRVVYSPLDALDLARGHPEKTVVFLGVGFETTAPATAMAVFRARRENLRNFSLLASHVLVPPAIESILGAPECRIQAFLAAGHVCTVMGYRAYEPIASRYRVPIVVTGFEPLDILQGVLMAVRQLEQVRAEVENQYARSVRPEGNTAARRLVAEVFRIVSRRWRGVGEIERSGLALAPEYAEHDAELRFGAVGAGRELATECISASVLRGVAKPFQCPAFATRCTPERPLGAPMVSSEGACAAYYRYRRRPGIRLGADEVATPS